MAYGRFQCIVDLTFTSGFDSIVFVACWFKSWCTFAIVAAWLVDACGMLSTFIEICILAFINV